jgi:hypothetical protein
MMAKPRMKSGPKEGKEEGDREARRRRKGSETVYNCCPRRAEGRGVPIYMCGSSPHLVLVRKYRVAEGNRGAERAVSKPPGRKEL